MLNIRIPLNGKRKQAVNNILLPMHIVLYMRDIADKCALTPYTYYIHMWQFTTARLHLHPSSAAKDIKLFTHNRRVHLVTF